jgi:hypothetical protein
LTRAAPASRCLASEPISLPRWAHVSSHIAQQMRSN